MTWLARVPSEYVPPYVGSLLLMHFDGSNGGTTFTDSTGRNTFSIAGGTPTTSSNQVKFGTTSYLGWIGSYASTGIIANNTAWSGFCDSDFTIEFWIYMVSPLAAAGPLQILSTAAASANNPYMAISTGNTGQMTMYWVGNTGTSYAGGFSGNITAGAWYHIAFVRMSNVLKCYIGGMSGATTYNVTGSATTGLRYVDVGSYYAFTTNSFGSANGCYVDELRISNYAVYTGNFTPPTGPFTS